MLIPKPKEVIDLRARYDWKKVEAPKAWRPQASGEELVGYYGGKTVRNGQWGQYEVILVNVPRRGIFMMSGTNIVQLVDAASIDIGHPIRVVWKGKIKLDKDKEMKVFEVFVATDEEVGVEEPEQREDA